MKSIVPLLGLLLCCFTSAFAVLNDNGAQEVGPVLSLRYSKSGTTVTMQLDSAVSLSNCEYTILGASKRNHFDSESSKVRDIFTFATSSESLQLIARKVRSLRGIGHARRSLYFRAKLSCEDNESFSDVERIRVRVASRGIRGVSEWLDNLGSKLSPLQVKLTRVFAGLSFDKPVALVSPPDSSNRLFMVEQGGRVYVFDNNPDTTTKSQFLDLSGKISTGGERGLLGLAFHPNYATNGFFYVNYTEFRPDDSGLSRSVVARYKAASGNPLLADSGSEERLLVLNQPYNNHNGGDLVFCFDGYLYIPFGDGGSAGDPENYAQNRKSLLGKVLRIDVDKKDGSRNYSIPASNPFVGNGQGFREEIFAYGFRNPYRITCDETSQRIWVADVGQGDIEEIDLLKVGKNYGWNKMEGSQCYPPSNSCSKKGMELPVDEYNHSVGRSVIGGYVYRGSAISSLIGRYVFADFVTGLIFSLSYDGQTAKRTTLLDTSHLISSFGQDAARELYVLSYADGAIYRIDPVE